MSSSGLLEKPTSVTTLRESVAQAIRDAFADVPYPGDDGICKSGSDGKEVVRDLRGLHWRDMDITTVTNHHVDLPMLTPEAFRFYLPAFMLALMTHYQHAGTLPMSLLHNLTPPDSGSLEKYMDNPTDPSKHGRVGDFLNRVTAFSPKEKAAIRLFLETYDKWCPKLRGEQRLMQRAYEFWRTR